MLMKKLLLLLFSITLSFSVSSNEDLSKYESLGLKTVVAFKCANMLAYYEFSTSLLLSMEILGVKEG